MHMEVEFTHYIGLLNNGFMASTTTGLCLLSLFLYQDVVPNIRIWQPNHAME